MQNLLSRFKSDQFLKHNAIFFIGSISVSAINYFYHPIMSRLMTVENFGEVQTLISLFTQASLMLGVFNIIGINITANHENPTEQQRKLSQLHLFASYLMLALSCAIVIASPFVRHLLQFQSFLPIAVLAPIFLGAVPLTFRRSYLQGTHDFPSLSIAGLIVAGGRLVFGVLLVLAGLSTLGAISGLLIAQFLSVGYVYKKTYRALNLPLRQKFRLNQELRHELFYGLLIFCSTSLVTFLSTSDIVVVKYFFAPDIAGFYAGISTISNIIFFATGSIAGVLIATIKLKNTRQENFRILAKAFILIGLIGGSGLILFSLVPHLVIKILLGQRYLVYADLLPRVAMVTFTCSLVNILSSYFLALRRKMILFISGIGALVTVILIALFHTTPASIVNDFLAASISTFILLCLFFIWSLKNQKSTADIF